MSDVSPWSLQFSTRTSADFVYKGRPHSVEKWTEMFHSVFGATKEILEGQLLLGMKPPELPTMADNHSNNSLGFGILVGHGEFAWDVQRHIMNDDKLRARYYYQDGALIRQRWHAYLKTCDQFKRNIYFLMHFLAGMPKRLTEEWRMRIVNTPDRQRNIFGNFSTLLMLGSYNKTTSLTGNDKTTLHFIPDAISSLMRLFYALVAPTEALVAGTIIPAERRHPDHTAYLWSSMGRRWKTEAMSKILQHYTKKYLGLSVDARAARHIVPAIADHYNIGHITIQHGNTVMSSQMGHTDDTHRRLYSRVQDGFEGMTAKFFHDTQDFCVKWQELFGFRTTVPDKSAGLRVQREFIINQSLTFGTLSQGVEHAGEDIRRLEQRIAELTNLLSGRVETSDTSIRPIARFDLNHEPIFPMLSSPTSHPPEVDDTRHGAPSRRITRSSTASALHDPSSSDSHVAISPLQNNQEASTNEGSENQCGRFILSYDIFPGSLYCTQCKVGALRMNTVYLCSSIVQRS